MTPIHIDPERPATQISHPGFFADYLAKSIGPFGTVGLMEDTAAVNDGVLSEQAFLAQTWQFYKERKAMLLKVLQNGCDDVTIGVVDTPDRIQHMFWRYLEEDPSAPEDKTRHARSNVIERMYIEMDTLLGEVRKHLSRDTLFLVVSDHGFTSFRRGVNLNAWLYKEGYLKLLSGCKGDQDWLSGVDWSATKAYALGLTGIYINLTGRESSGIVQPGDEYDRLVQELKGKLEALEDPGQHDACGRPRRPIRRIFLTQTEFTGPFRREGPDLIVGYDNGYRCSWEAATGEVRGEVFCDNTHPWSGDHCVDPDLVPGVLFANVPLTEGDPHIMDIAPTVLDVFGIEPKATMQGRSLLKTNRTAVNARA
jgi:predicted AlkP superfamily phosphohydrolase/phosphomutase